LLTVLAVRGDVQPGVEGSEVDVEEAIKEALEEQMDEDEQGNHAPSTRGTCTPAVLPHRGSPIGVHRCQARVRLRRMWRRLRVMIRWMRRTWYATSPFSNRGALHRQEHPRLSTS
jgi:hypothetical protein